jgi:hypothetical protein
MSAAASAAVLVWPYLECANAAANDRPTGTTDRSSKYEKTTMMDPLSERWIFDGATWTDWPRVRPRAGGRLSSLRHDYPEAEPFRRNRDI